MQKQIAIPKPAKRPMRTIQDEAEEEESEPLVIERKSSELSVSEDKVLRPTRTAKAKANLNLVSSSYN